MKKNDSQILDVCFSDEKPGRSSERKAVKRKTSNRTGGRKDSRLFIPLLPLFFVIGVVPLVVFLKVTPVPPEYGQFWVTDFVFDFFSYYKARILIACAGLVLMGVLVLAYKHILPRKKSVLFIPLAVYTAMVIVSTILSRHPSIALGGYFDRAEGMWVLLAYGILLVGTYLFVSDSVQAWWILAAWAVALCIICILGIFQYFGFDFFSSLAGRLLILPTKYHSIAAVLDFTFPRNSIYSTLYNPDNVASMMVLAFPLAAACFILARSRNCQFAFGLLAGLLSFTLLGCHGLAGWAAALAALILIAVFSMRKGFAGGWQRLGILALVIVVEFGCLTYFGGRSVALQAGNFLTEPGKTQDPTDQTLVEPGTPSEEGQVSGTDESQGSEAQAGPVEQLIRQYGKTASGRVYIWLRSMQIARDTIFLGHGPDTFALYFPNQDPYKINTALFIDKPHNMYIQLWLNLGGVATVAFLAMVIMHCLGTFRVLRRSNSTGELYVLALGLFAGWFAYLLAAFFYDSAVSVAPAFWIVFGLSMAMNNALNKKNLLEHGHDTLGPDRR
jgi:hypothetical protein